MKNGLVGKQMGRGGGNGRNHQSKCGMVENWPQRFVITLQETAP
jgi:hypothetical protein